MCACRRFRAQEKKKITWIGLPGGVSQHVSRLGEEKRRREARLKEKRAHLAELLVYIVALRHLTQRNEKAQAAGLHGGSSEQHVPLRFVLIKTAASNIVHLSVSPDQTELQCDVSGRFVLHDEGEVLREMGLAMIEGFDLPYLIPREICAFYPTKFLQRGTQPQPTSTIDETVEAKSALAPRSAWEG